MITDFQTFDLHPRVLKAVHDLDYEVPTPIQAHAIPKLMAGRDVLGQAQTGTGKTAAFALPLLHTLDDAESRVKGLVVVPTRELAIQVTKAIGEYGQHRRVRVLAVYGGQSYSPQIRGLERGVDIVVGTPGRMLDLIRKGILDLSEVQYLVLDEADEMLSMGFIEDIEAILDETPRTRQTAFFSATLPEPIRRLADRYMSEPEAIVVNPTHMTVEQTEQRYYLLNESDKLEALSRLLEVESVTRALVFTRTRVGSAELAEALFARGVHAEALHGDMSQPARETVMGHFRRGRIDVLVATDVAARGLDIDDISHVINYDIPFDPEAYVHRIGRTGRAGKTGIAITFITPRQQWRLRKIERYTSQRIPQATLPSDDDIRAHRETLFLDKMLAKLVPEQNTRGQDPAMASVIRLCEMGYAPFDIAAAAIELAREEDLGRPIEPIAEVKPPSKRRRHRSNGRHHGRKSRRRRDGRRPEAGMTKLTMDVGKAQGIRPGDVVGAIASEANIPGGAIGFIDIQGQRTFVDVAEKYVDRVLLKMQRSRLRGHAVTFGRADS
jgi:ATP-dependent RNA helicase DeaD